MTNVLRDGILFLTLTLAFVYASTPGLEQVEHIVIYMQENRAFDHYFGHLRGVRGFGDRAAITLPSGMPVWYQPTNETDVDYMLPWHMDVSTTSGVCGSAPQMDYPCDIAMWNNGRMDSWNSARDPGLGMAFWERKDLDFYYALADAFTICDQYFQSTFTATNPNRLHLFSGTNGPTAGFPAVLDDTEPNPGFSWLTMGEVLESAGISWKVYQQEDNFDDNAFAWFEQYMNASKDSPLYQKGMVRQPDLVKAFGDDMAAGTLPQVSWIVGPANLSEHAAYLPPLGEDLTARILKQLEANPKVFAKMIFVMDYDEGGQFFDHAWTPTPPATPEEGISTVSTEGEILPGGTPNGLGFRVPAFIISPWSQGGWVNSQVFDHTSVIQLVEERFGVHCPNISPWRRAICGNLTSALDWAHPNYTWPLLPDTSNYTRIAIEECSNLPPPQVPEVQSMPTQEPGTRPSRALPYAFAAQGSVDPKGNFVFLLANTGNAGAAFYLYDNETRTNSPRKYTVEAGKKISDSWPLNQETTSYSYILYGPNGYVRHFGGPVVQHKNFQPHVFLREDGAVGKLHLSVDNDGAKDVQVTISANSVYEGHKADNVDFKVRAGKSHEVKVTGLETSGGWYDVVVQVAHGDHPVYVRRFMGRSESGKHSISDPAAVVTPALNPFVASSHPKIPPKLSGRAFWEVVDVESCHSTIMTQK